MEKSVLIWVLRAPAFILPTQRMVMVIALAPRWHHHTLPEGLLLCICLLYTSDAADERSSVDLGGRRIIKKKKQRKKKQHIKKKKKKHIPQVRKHIATMQ